MARGDQTAQTGENQSLANASTLNSNASALFSALAPTLSGDIAHPAGYSPSEMADMNTAAEQSAGGAQAATVGQAGLLAGRTRNAGAAQDAIASAGRRASQGLSSAALGIQNKNAELKQQQRESAIGGEEGLFGANVSGGNNAAAQVANLSGANLNAEKNDPWNQFWSAVAGSAGKGVGSGLAAGATGGGE